MLAAAFATCAAQAPRRPNVVFFFMDTVRSDHLGCYGYARPTTPALDRLAAGGTLFENAFAQATWSLSSYASVFTSLYVQEHGVDTQSQALAARLLTLAEILTNYGYETAAFVGGGHLLPSFGLAQGFASYSSGRVPTSISVTADQADRWLRSRGEGPFFLLVHGYDAHMPYQSPQGFGEMYDPDYRGIVHAPGFLTEEILGSISKNHFRPCDLASFRAQVSERVKSPFPTDDNLPPTGGRLGSVSLPLRMPELLRALTAADREHVIAHYDGAISWSDLALARFLDSMEQQGVLKNTLVFVAGDHGEQLFEHGILGHGGPPLRQLVQVPLVVHGPGVAAGRRVKDAVGLIDLAPTVLQMAGAVPCQQHQGKSLAAYMATSGPVPSQPDRAAFSTFEDHYSIWTDGWHLIVHDPGGGMPKPMLFHTTNDPYELVNLSGDQPDRLKLLSDRLDDWRQERASVTTAPKAEVGKTNQGILRRFGYW